LTLVLLAFGTGIGASLVSPWSDSGISTTSFKLVRRLSVLRCSTRLKHWRLLGRAPSHQMDRISHQRGFFRDTAYGFLAWAFSTILSAAILSSATTHIIAGASTVLTGAAAQRTNPSDIYVDRLLRREPGGPTAAQGSPPALPAPRPIISPASSSRACGFQHEDRRLPRR
jgi:hypothetical protein